ncbi:agmatinase [Candidatus Woesearchaeota archaeon]|nr:agmatinase [Candidatus Woesearchaeota archaeon]
MIYIKLAWCNTNDINSANYVVLGVNDESGNRSYRGGSSRAPDKIRSVSIQRAVYEKNRKALPQSGVLNKKIFDYGNIRKSKISSFIEKSAKNGKIPVVIGGDHSITTEILRGFDKLNKPISIVYFDSHPDFICSSNKKYYGSVVCDIQEYENIKFKSSIEVGIRAPEQEELKNIRKKYLKTIKSVDVIEKGIKDVFNDIKRRVGNNIYVTIDMDVVDPSFAPGVSTPVPGGITSNEIIYLLKKISSLGIIGMDIVEVTPKYDVNDMTSHLAAKMIIEAIASNSR